MASSSTDIYGLEQLMDELVVICESKDLSIESLKAKIKLLPSQTLSGVYEHHYLSRPFLHAACMNKNVTLEIIGYLLNAFPLVEILPTSCLCPEGTTVSYALHCACYNDYCPNEVVELLVTKNSVALKHFCLVDKGIIYHYHIHRLSPPTKQKWLSATELFLTSNLITSFGQLLL